MIFGKVINGIVVSAVVAVLCACTLPLAKEDVPITVIVREKSFSLYWDKPLEGSAADEGGRIAGYNIYARSRENYQWVKMGSTASDNETSFRMTSDLAPAGRYEFAVASYTEIGLESGMHRSTDGNADPVTGWIVNWIQSE